MTLTEYTWDRIKQEPNFFYTSDKNGGYAIIYVYYDSISEKFMFGMQDSDEQRYMAIGEYGIINPLNYMLNWTGSYFLLDDLIDKSKTKSKIKIYKRTNLIDDFI